MVRSVGRKALLKMLQGVPLKIQRSMRPHKESWHYHTRVRDHAIDVEREVIECWWFIPLCHYIFKHLWSRPLPKLCGLVWTWIWQSVRDADEEAVAWQSSRVSRTKGALVAPLPISPSRAEAAFGEAVITRIKLRFWFSFPICQKESHVCSIYLTVHLGESKVQLAKDYHFCFRHILDDQSWLENWEHWR